MFLANDARDWPIVLTRIAHCLLSRTDPRHPLPLLLQDMPSLWIEFGNPDIAICGIAYRA